MRKSKDISKYDLNWQIFRVSLKKLKTVQEKIYAAENYLIKNCNKADKERVLNYLEGLSMSYTDERRDIVKSKFNDLLLMEVSEENNTSTNFDEYSKEELNGLMKDLMIRTKNWLANGYNNKELNDFILSIAIYLNSTNIINQLDNLKQEAVYKQNTHKFFF